MNGNIPPEILQAAMRAQLARQVLSASLVRNIPVPGQPGVEYGYGPGPERETIFPHYWRQTPGQGWVPEPIPAGMSPAVPQIPGPRFDPGQIPILPYQQIGPYIFPSMRHYEPLFGSANLQLLA
jgi:hypothetical protein